MKILVTGGIGFLGKHLIPKLVEDGHQVLALTRSASSHEALRALGASPVAGDLQSRNLHIPYPQSTPACTRPPCSASLGRARPTSGPTSMARMCCCALPRRQVRGLTPHFRMPERTLLPEITCDLSIPAALERLAFGCANRPSPFANGGLQRSIDCIRRMGWVSRHEW
jgi:NAD(P)-dependent dehydrogenase (short-subunit alcohol dehydrogenase family)